MAGADDVDDVDGAPAAPDGVLGVDELHIVHTQFQSLMTQTPAAHVPRADAGRGDARRTSTRRLLPAYEFEPDPDALLDALLPKYINTRIYAALLDAAASESAARRRAMKARHRQRGRHDQDADAGDELRPAGRDHPGNQ